MGVPTPRGVNDLTGVDLDALRWAKPGKCDVDPNDPSSCFERTVLPDGRRLVRNSTDPDGPMVAFTAEEWAGMLADVRAGGRLD